MGNYLQYMEEINIIEHDEKGNPERVNNGKS